MKAKQVLKTLDYLPRWAWYMLSLFVAGPFGPMAVYLVFHVLRKIEQEQEEQEHGSAYARRADAYGSAQAYEDEECVVSSDEEINRQWAQTKASAAQASAAHAQARKQEPIDEDAGVDEVIRSGYDAMRRIRQANDIIADEALSAQIDSIESSCGQILSILEQRPQLLPQLRTFLRYYLPTTLKLLDARARLENTANTRKAREVRTRISEAVGVIDKAFQKQVEALDEYRFIDLESEMDVLRDML
ncbi:MAG: 5-bromo-4-chloroindolyl phosphate hydrolysis family protein, partial [Candidatus Ventricola sp.]